MMQDLSTEYTRLTTFIIPLRDQNKVLCGALRARSRWVPIMLMKYRRNIVTRAICWDKKKKKVPAHRVRENVFLQVRG